MKKMRPALSLALICASTAALAQPLPPPPPQGGRLDVQTLNFDLWCQETQKLPPERCDKNLPEDEAAFEDYRAKVERYEVPYLKQKERDSTINRVILHSDPAQNPVNYPLQPPGANP